MVGFRFSTTSAVIGAASLLAYQTGADAVSHGHLRKLQNTDDYTHLGCFMDNMDDRVLGYMLASEDTTPDVCYDYCVGMDAPLMATQWGIECWCATEVEIDHERHGDGAQCDSPCAGDENEMCGGRLTFDLYRIESTNTPREETGTPEEWWEDMDSYKDYDYSYSYSYPDYEDDDYSYSYLEEDDGDEEGGGAGDEDVTDYPTPSPASGGMDMPTCSEEDSSMDMPTGSEDESSMDMPTGSEEDKGETPAPFEMPATSAPASPSPTEAETQGIGGDADNEMYESDSGEGDEVSIDSSSSDGLKRERLSYPQHAGDY